MKNDFLSNNQLLITVLDNISECIIIFDFDFNPLYINQATLNSSGYSNSDIGIIKLNDMLPKSEKESLNDIIGKLINSNDPIEKDFLFYKKNRELTRADTKIKKISQTQ